MVVDDLLCTLCQLLTWPSRFDSKTPLMKQVPFGSSDTVKISLTAKNNGKAKRPHQAFVVLKEVESGLEAPFPLTVKENGEGSVEIVSAWVWVWDKSTRLRWLSNLARRVVSEGPPSPVPTCYQIPSGLDNRGIFRICRGPEHPRLQSRSHSRFECAGSEL